MKKSLIISVSIISLMIISMSFFSPSVSPHGKDLKLNCTECHTTDGWKMDSNYSFKHSTTNFQLLGLHSTVDCKSCHPTLIFNETGTDCSSCHSDVHESTVGVDCQRCHNPNSWLVSNIIEMHQATRFPLVGAHVGADCYDCHKSESHLQFPQMSVDCIGCHTKDFNEAINPNHVAANFSTDCENCHNISAPEWNSTGFDHNNFPLTLAHNIKDCNECHDQNDYTAVPKTCFGCHEDAYNSSINPNHTVSGFSVDCIDCHTTNPGWKPASYDHTDFPLTLAHNIDDCTECHNANDYSATPNTCFECHKEAYNSSSQPNHIASGFTTDCTECHNANPGWKPATFDHTTFPLTLGHNIEDCNACHDQNNFSSTPNTCFACHEDVFNSTTNPNHIASGFSTDCTVCHTTNPGWKPATFDHDPWFPIYSGEHNGEWNSCTDCHSNSSDYNQFTCIDCHEHRKSEMDSEHNGVTDYVYTSSACFDCHPIGKADD